MNPNFNTNTAAIRTQSIPAELHLNDWSMVHSKPSLSLAWLKSNSISLERCPLNKRGALAPFRQSELRGGATPLDFHIMQHLVMIPDFFSFMIGKISADYDQITILCAGTTLVSEDKHDEAMIFLSYKKGAKEVEVGILPKFKYCKLKNVYRLVYKPVHPQRNFA